MILLLSTHKTSSTRRQQREFSARIGVHIRVTGNHIISTFWNVFVRRRVLFHSVLARRSASVSHISVGGGACCQHQLAANSMVRARP